METTTAPNTPRLRATTQRGPDGRSFSSAAHSRILDNFVAPQQVGDEKKPPRPAKNSRLEELHSVLHPWLRGRGFLLFDEYYKLALSRLEGRQYSASEIEQFSLELTRHQKIKRIDGSFEEVGAFFSALINTSPDQHFVIHTSHLKKEVGYLGFANTSKDILVQGNAGAATGFNSWGGSITVQGDVGQYTAESTTAGSTVRVNGKIGGLGDYVYATVYKEGRLLCQNHSYV